MSNLILAVKVILALQQLLQGLLDSITASRNEDEKKILNEAIEAVKTAKTKEEKN